MIEKVLCQLPGTGLGNQLFPLMKAQLMAHLNGLPVSITNYHQLKIGPYLRGEKSKRNYLGYFKFQKNLVRDWLDRAKFFALRSNVIDEPEVRLLTDPSEKKIYRFSRMPHWNNYFDQLKEHRKLVIKLFWELLTDEIKIEVESKACPMIGVHIRMGDFRKLTAQEDFSKVGLVRTPENYFKDIIQSIRSINGNNLPVSIFTDGRREELQEIFELENISLVEGNKDIVDLLLLSKSKIIVTSAGSTFSYWAGFLSDAPIIMHPDHIHEPLRGNIMYEGPLNSQNKSLVQSITSIRSDG